MNTKIEKIISVGVLAFGLITTGFIVANAQTNTTTSPSITFPIPELGNCADQESCKNYCNTPNHMSVCLDFAATHKMMSAEDIARARKMAELSTKGGPGGCTSKDTCEAYCNDSTHTDECIAFAEKSGMLSGKDLEDAKRVLPLMARGETPGNCKTKNQCETYCGDSSHTDECVAFAEKAGFISKEDADIVRKTGGKGPGGCSSRESCDAFCNIKENQETCFTFAKEHNLIQPEELKTIKEGTARLRMGMNQFPGEVVQCLKQKLGEDAVGKIESGQLTPDKNLGTAVQGCFEEFKPKMKAKMEEGLKYAPPEVMNCLQTSLNAEDFAKMKQGEIDAPEKGDVIRSCFEKMRGTMKERVQRGSGIMSQIPEGARACIEQKLGGDIFERMQSGDPEKMQGLNQTDIQTSVMSCMSQFKSPMPTINGPLPAIPTSSSIPIPKQGESYPTGPTPEQIQQMMPGNTPIQQPTQPFPNIPTPQQIQQMMQQQIPLQGIPQTAPEPMPQYNY